MIIINEILIQDVHLGAAGITNNMYLLKGNGERHINRNIAIGSLIAQMIPYKFLKYQEADNISALTLPGELSMKKMMYTMLFLQG